jgi:hypothetical protein
LKNNKA